MLRTCSGTRASKPRRYGQPFVENEPAKESLIIFLLKVSVLLDRTPKVLFLKIFVDKQPSHRELESPPN